MKIFIEKLWLEGKTCTFVIQNRVQKLNAEAEILKMRSQFVKKLQSEGFEIIIDKSLIDEDTICLIMDESAISCDFERDYTIEFQKRMAMNGGVDFRFPRTVSLSEYFEKPFFPAVFKNQYQNGGVDKFLIVNMEQVETMKSFFQTFVDNDEARVEDVVIQEFIETPSKYSTYLRVLVDGNGEPLGASLKYSNQGNSSSEIRGYFEKVFLKPSSEYYICATKMFNYYSGGGDIYFTQPKFSDEKRYVLESHGFDVNNFCLPDEVLNVTRSIMTNCNRELGVLCGMDFMMNVKDGHWYYLENQAFPAINEWAQQRGIKLPKDGSIKTYLEVLKIELDCRYEALMNTVKRKKYEKGDI